MYCLVAKITLESLYGSLDESGIKRMCHKLSQNFSITIKSVLSKDEFENPYLVICALSHQANTLSPLIERIASFIEKDGSIRTGAIEYCVKDIEWYLAQNA